MQEVTRHRCNNDECSIACSCAVDPYDFDINDRCPECGTKGYKRESRKIKPRRVFYYFGAANALETLPRNSVFKANRKNNIDITKNEYRSSPDAKRLGKSTDGKALAENSGLHISMANGFQSHNSKTCFIKGKHLFDFMLILCFLQSLGVVVIDVRNTVLYFTEYYLLLSS